MKGIYLDSNKYAKYRKLYNRYKKILDIPTIESVFYQDDINAFNYCKKRDFIVMVVPFIEPDSGIIETVLLNNMLISYNRMHYSLFGGSVSDSSFDDFLSSTKDIIVEKLNLEKEHKGVVEELRPIAFIENTFHYKNTQTTHEGILFVGRIPKELRINNELKKGSVDEDFLFVNPHNSEAFRLSQKYLSNYRVSNQILNEISYAKKLLTDEINVKEKKEKFIKQNKINLEDYYAFKKLLVNDIVWFSEKCKKNSIADIACGDDNIIHEVKKRNRNIETYANDIALTYISEFHKKKYDDNEVAYLSIDVNDLPIKKNAFGVILCKNLLHHIVKNKRKNLLLSLIDKCQILFLVEILHYTEQNENGKLLHDMFFNKELKEVSDSNDYLIEMDVDNYLKKIEDDCVTIIKNEKIETGNGVYKYCIIKKYITE